VRDNGPGVDPGLETAIFEPFVSGRTGDEGRGLGLFIARQVLNDDNVTIYLGEPDKAERRRTFVLDFTGAMP
jgi:nitrogen-specific signal transduction histidine kinase